MSLTLFYITNNAQEKLYCGLGGSSEDLYWKDFYKKTQTVAASSYFPQASMVVQVMEGGPFSFDEQKTKIALCAIFIDSDLTTLNKPFIEEGFNEELVEISVHVLPEKNRSELQSLLNVSQKMSQSSKAEVMLIMSALDETVLNTINIEAQAGRDKILIQENIPAQAGTIKTKKM